MFLDFFVDDLLLKKEARKFFMVKISIKNEKKNTKPKEVIMKQNLIRNRDLRLNFKIWEKLSTCKSWEIHEIILTNKERILFKKLNVDAIQRFPILYHELS
jgi:hypothetical protein